MTLPKTLLGHAGVVLPVGTWADSTLVVIDAQREYTEGAVRLHNIDAAVEEVATLLHAARKAGAPVVHVFHKSPPGAPIFAIDSPMFLPIPGVEPVEGEDAVEKLQASSFAGTNFGEVLAKHGRQSLVVVGFMTHMCVSTTVRRASEKGYRSTVVAAATTTRDLPNQLPAGGVVPAESVQAAALAAMGDRFAVIVPDASYIK